MTPSFELEFEKIITFFTKPPHQEEVIDGKKYFFSKLGIGADDPDGYEARLNLFFDWFLFTRPLVANGKKPVEFLLQAPDFKIDGELQEIYDAFAKTEHSLYEVLKIKNRDIYLKDLFSNQKKFIKDSPYTYGFEKGQIFDGRLIPYKDMYMFAKSFCFHPVEVRRFIVKEIKKCKKEEGDNPEDLMLRLMQMKFKVEKYRHLKLNDVYSNTQLVRF